MSRASPIQSSQYQGKQAEAGQRLGETKHCFTEGCVRADRKEAGALLEERASY